MYSNLHISKQQHYMLTKSLMIQISLIAIIRCESEVTYIQKPRDIFLKFLTRNKLLLCTWFLGSFSALIQLNPRKWN